MSSLLLGSKFVKQFLQLTFVSESSRTAEQNITRKKNTIVFSQVLSILIPIVL